MVLSPILWHLWIYAGGAIAKFYFAIALAFSTTQVSMVCMLQYFKIGFYLLQSGHYFSREHGLVTDVLIKLHIKLVLHLWNNSSYHMIYK